MFVTKKARSSSPTQRKQKAALSPLIIGSVVVAAVLIVAGLVLLGNRQERNLRSPLDATQFPAKGSAEAPVTIVEFSDFGCSHCRGFIMEKSQLLEDEFVASGRVRYVVHPFTLGPATALASEAAWCAADQGQFFPYQRKLYENFGMPLDQASLVAAAAGLALDQAAFSTCLSSRTHQLDVEKARQEAIRQGINATPTFFINKQRLEGNLPYEQFQAVINQELAAAQ
jgi:protein-disulfide isomerase